MDGPLFPGFIGQRALQRVFIALRPQPADSPDSMVAEIGVAPEGLTRVQVGKMYLDVGNAHSGERIAQGHTGMGEGCRIDDDEIDASRAGSLDTLDQLGLGVA